MVQISVSKSKLQQIILNELRRLGCNRLEAVWIYESADGGWSVGPVGGDAAKVGSVWGTAMRKLCGYKLIPGSE